MNDKLDKHSSACCDVREASTNMMDERFSVLTVCSVPSHQHFGCHGYATEIFNLKLIGWNMPDCEAKLPGFVWIGLDLS